MTVLVAMLLALICPGQVRGFQPGLTGARGLVTGAHGGAGLAVFARGVINVIAVMA